MKYSMLAIIDLFSEFAGSEVYPVKNLLWPGLPKKLADGQRVDASGGAIAQK